MVGLRVAALRDVLLGGSARYNEPLAWSPGGSHKFPLYSPIIASNCFWIGSACIGGKLSILLRTSSAKLSGVWSFHIKTRITVQLSWKIPRE